MSDCVTYKQHGQKKILLCTCINYNRKICTVIFLLDFSLHFNCLVFCDLRYIASDGVPLKIHVVKVPFFKF